MEHPTQRTLRKHHLAEKEIAEILKCAHSNFILVGGQALAYWMVYYGIHAEEEKAFTFDVDFLIDSSECVTEINDFAKKIQGKAILQPQEVLSSLLGTVEKVNDRQELIAVDFIFKVFDLSCEEMRKLKKRAVDVDYLGNTIKVMDPLDVLQSRLVNLQKLKEKQAGNGAMQLLMALKMIKALQEQEELDWKNRSGLIQSLLKMNNSSSGKTVKQDHGINLADFIVCHPSSPKKFLEHQWPRIQNLQSHAIISKPKPRTIR